MRTRHSLEAENRELRALVNALKQGWLTERAERAKERRLRKVRDTQAAYGRLSDAEKADLYRQGRGL